MRPRAAPASASIEAVRLLCFAHAGATAAAFRGWQEALPRWVDARPVELRGRGSRITEQPLRRLEAIVDDVLAYAEPNLEPPFALFGHSMGALVAFELARALRRARRAPPRLLILSGHAAPHLSARRMPLHGLPDAALLAALRDLDGTPEFVLAERELWAIWLPVIRADFAACETYVHRREPALDIPIVAMGGLRDATVVESELEAWSVHTSLRFRLRMFGGDHFFITRTPTLVLRAIAAELARGEPPR